MPLRCRVEDVERWASASQYNPQSRFVITRNQCAQDWLQLRAALAEAVDDLGGLAGGEYTEILYSIRLVREKLSALLADDAPGTRRGRP